MKTAAGPDGNPPVRSLIKLTRCLGEGTDHLRGDRLGAGVIEHGLGALVVAIVPETA